MTKIGMSAYTRGIMPILFIVFAFLLSTAPVFAGGDTGGGGGVGVNGSGGGGDLSPTSTQNPFALFEFVMELVAFAAVLYLTLVRKDQRRRIFTAASVSIRTAGVYFGQLAARNTIYARRQSHD
jgi:hypothetical protein